MIPTQQIFAWFHRAACCIWHGILEPVVLGGSDAIILCCIGFRCTMVLAKTTPATVIVKACRRRCSLPMALSRNPGLQWTKLLCAPAAPQTSCGPQCSALSLIA
ncbi:unnamed protein product [Durusdinium trenchii]|uniref:Uncharacterized protein n=2 Tax=Durusdinium trenchii TaxID=1381693 RepID=A0ABP0STF6_9DINO